MSRQSWKPRTTFLVLAAFVSVCMAPPQDVSEREAELALDCFDGDEDACEELEQLQAGSNVDQQPSIVSTTDSHRVLFDTYRESSIRPRQLDSFVEANRPFFDSHFFSCLNSVRDTAPALSKTHDEQCWADPDPARRQNCLQQNVWRGMGGYLSDLERTIRSQGAVGWLQTASGQQAAAAMQPLESLMSQFRHEQYPQLEFVLGKQVADQRLEIYRQQLFGRLEEWVEILRGPLSCP